MPGGCQVAAVQDASRNEPEQRVRASFDKQGLMTTLGATLESVSPGSVEIALRPRPDISQQHGFVHAGAVSAIADSAAGYAALSLMPEGAGVLTVEFKINLLAPAAGAVLAPSASRCGCRAQKREHVRDVVGLADLHAFLPQDHVGGDDVEVELAERPVTGELGSR